MLHTCTDSPTHWVVWLKVKWMWFLLDYTEYRGITYLLSAWQAHRHRISFGWLEQWGGGWSGGVGGVSRWDGEKRERGVYKVLKAFVSASVIWIMRLPTFREETWMSFISNSFFIRQTCLHSNAGITQAHSGPSFILSQSQFKMSPSPPLPKFFSFPALFYPNLSKVVCGDMRCERDTALFPFSSLCVSEWLERTWKREPTLTNSQAIWIKHTLLT